MEHPRLAAVVLATALSVGAIAACSGGPPVPTFGPGPVSTSEPSARVWMRLPDSPLSARREAVGAWLGDRFVVVGGLTGAPCPPNADCPRSKEPVLRSGAAFDPATGDWHDIASAPLGLSGQNAVVADGAMYTVASELLRRNELPSLLRYDPAADSWAVFLAPLAAAAELIAGDGEVFAIASTDEYGPRSDWRFDATTERWRPLPDDPLGPSFDREAVWFDGALILTAKDLVASPGSEEPAIVRMARFDPVSGQWSVLPDTGLIGWSPTVVGELIVFPHPGSADGGEVGNWGRDVPFGGILTPAEGSWRALPTPPSDGALPGELLTVAGSVLVGGHLLDPATGGWLLLPSLPAPKRSSATVIAGEAAILVWGGNTATGNLAGGYLLPVDSLD